MGRRPVTDQPETCWNCGKELGYHIVVVIHELDIADANVVRPTCGPTCARKACGWYGTTEKDKVVA